MEEKGQPEWQSRIWLIAGSVLAVLALLLAVAGFDSPRTARGVIIVAGAITLAIVAWAAIRTRQQRRRYQAELASWTATQAVQAERLRIARDLHDLASHGLGTITVRAVAARYSTGESDYIAALTDIEDTSRKATTELRRMLMVLRSPEEADASFLPAETMDDLPAIIAAAETTGLSVAASIDDIEELSAGAQLAICAIVREGLANINRHAGPVPATVNVEKTGDHIVVSVENRQSTPGWAPARGAGHGILGLRERVATLGGTVEAQQAAGGFLLTAQIPAESTR